MSMTSYHLQAETAAELDALLSQTAKIDTSPFIQ
jgi:hypothetical protein